MLTALRLKNLALVEKLRVTFEPGLNVITGETGAGKSVLMGALGLLLGERADKGLIRSGEEACGVEASFHLEDPGPVNTVLEACGLEPCADGELVLRRILRVDGRNQILINDSPSTLQGLKNVGDRLVDMHGPHEHQSLFLPNEQLALLDAYAGNGEERQVYGEAHERMAALERQRRELEADQDDAGALIDLLSHRVREIGEAELREGEEEELRSEHDVMGHAQQIRDLGGGVLEALARGEPSAFDGLAAARRGLEQLAHLLPRAAGWGSRLDEAIRQVRELDAEIGAELESIEVLPARLEWLDQRLTVYQKLKRKYGPEVADVLHAHEEARARLEDLEHREERLAALDAERARAHALVLEHGGALRETRRAAAEQLAREIERELAALGLKHGRFEIEVAACDPGPSGLDAVDFKFAPNVGEPMGSLRALASSGEISRVMLAIKTVLADQDRVPVLVFDEIDANIGGETAGAVGRKLADVATRHQVLCITHLPQVAAYGRNHFAVAKAVRSGRTVSEVSRLEGEPRVEEIARMLGGKNQTALTLDHARALLAKVQRK